MKIAFKCEIGEDVVVGITDIKEFTSQTFHSKSKAAAVKTVQQKRCLAEYLSLQERVLVKNIKNMVFIDPKTHHFCKYCANVVESDYDDLLCSDCREMFGHTMYSEL